VGKFDLHKDLTKPLHWGLDGSRSLDAWGFTEGIDNEGKLDGSSSYRKSGGTPQGPYLHFLAQRGLADIYVDEHARQRENGGAYTTALPDDAYCDNWLSENGLRFLRGFPRGRPWHLVVNFTGPHNPMDVTASMRARWEDAAIPPPHDAGDADPSLLLRKRQNYAAMIENIDRQVGRFLDVVRERGEADNTLVVFSADHGEMLGEHGMWGKSKWHDPSSGIPLIAAGPGVAGGRVSDALVSLHDLAATFLDCAGASPLPGADAISLRPLLGGRTDAHRPFLYSGLFNQAREGWDMIVADRWKLVRKDEACILHDLEADPYEDTDVAAAHPEVVRRLTSHFPR
jgi:arylsulfatase A-like enzyme